MSEKFEKILEIIAATLMVASLASCSNSEDAEAATAVSSDSQSEIVSEETAEDMQSEYDGDGWSVKYGTAEFTASESDGIFDLSYMNSTAGSDILEFDVSECETAQDAIDEITKEYADGEISEVTGTTVNGYNALTCKTVSEEGNGTYSVFTAVENNGSVVVISEFFTPETDETLMSEITAAFDAVISTFAFDAE